MFYRVVYEASCPSCGYPDARWVSATACQPRVAYCPGCGDADPNG